VSGRAEQLAWQRRAWHVIGHLLDLAAEGGPFPAAAWTAEPAGCQVTGRFWQPDPAERKAALTAWAEALGADVAEHPQLTGADLIARTRSEEDSLVRIVLVARIYAEDEDAGDELARAESDAEAWGGRGVSGSYEEWLNDENSGGSGE